MTPTAPTIYGHYPTDPSNDIGELINYFGGQGDYKNLCHAVYGLGGFVLFVTVGEPSTVSAATAVTAIDPQMLADQVNKLQVKMASSPQSQAMPPWVKTALTLALQGLLTWLQGKLTVAQFAKSGQLSAMPSP